MDGGIILGSSILNVNFLFGKLMSLCVSVLLQLLVFRLDRNNAQKLHGNLQIRLKFVVQAWRKML